MKRLLFIFLPVCFISASCSGSGDQQPPAIPEESNLLAELPSACGKYLYPALYSLEIPLPETAWKDILIGQPADVFSDFLNENDKAEILDQFKDHFSDSGETAAINRIRKWCIAAIAWHESTGIETSTEEFLAALYEKDRYSRLFEPYQNRPVFAFGNSDPIDKIASLSSAELTQLINDWFKLLSGLPDREFEDALSEAGFSVWNNDT
jgi:hypothetical protein